MEIAEPKVGVRFTPMGGTPDDYFLDSTDLEEIIWVRDLHIRRIIIRKGGGMFFI